MCTHIDVFVCLLEYTHSLDAAWTWLDKDVRQRCRQLHFCWATSCTDYVPEYLLEQLELCCCDALTMIEVQAIPSRQAH